MCSFHSTFVLVRLHLISLHTTYIIAMQSIAGDVLCDCEILVQYIVKLLVSCRPIKLKHTTQ